MVLTSTPDSIRHENGLQREGRKKEQLVLEKKDEQDTTAMKERIQCDSVVCSV